MIALASLPPWNEPSDLAARLHRYRKQRKAATTPAWPVQAFM
jgi:hypothetical protein